MAHGSADVWRVVATTWTWPREWSKLAWERQSANQNFIELMTTEDASKARGQNTSESGSYLICPDCLKQYGDAAVEFCPDDGARLRRLKLDPEEDKLLGQTIDDRWTIETKLGQGGMGAVYLAQQLNIERKVAIKVMRKGLDSGKEYIERFLREANVASQVSHPHMVSIYDFGQLEDGGLFIVMEYLDGVTLGERVLDNPLTIDQALEVTSQLCAALAAAHAGGIVHRDLKPDNIFLLDMPGGDIFVKVLDFGIAKHLNAQTAVTQTGQVFGTPEYMSPEQCRGESGIDQRSDLYSLGCILYELMTGRVPFRASSLLKVLFMHVSDPIPAIELKHPDGTLREVEEIALKLLEKDPDRRYKSALDVREALEHARRTIKSHDMPLPGWKIDRSKRAKRARDTGRVVDRSSQRDTANVLPNETALDITHAPLAETMLPGEDEDLQKILSGEVRPEVLETRTPEQEKSTAIIPEPLVEDDFTLPPSKSKILGGLVVLLCVLGAAGAALAAKYEVGPFEPKTDPSRRDAALVDNNANQTVAHLETTAPPQPDMATTPDASRDTANNANAASDMGEDAGGDDNSADAGSDTENDTSVAALSDDRGSKGSKGTKKIKRRVPEPSYSSPQTRAKTINRLAGKARTCMTYHRKRTPEMFAKYAGGSFKLEIAFKVAGDGNIFDVNILNKPQVDLPSADNFYSCITSRFQKVQFKPDALGNSYSYDRVFTFVVPQ